MQAFDEEEHGTDDSETSSEGGTSSPSSDPSPPIEIIVDKNKRLAAFKRRKNELMRGSYELSTLTGSQVLVLAVSENGLVYTFATTRLQGLVTRPEVRGNTLGNAVQQPIASERQQPISNVEDLSFGGLKEAGLMDTKEDSTEPAAQSDLNMKFAKKSSMAGKKYIRSERFWLSDGNIILSVRLEPPTKSAESRFILYRIHKSNLARHSEVFEHMFSATIPMAGEEAVNEMYDGLPVIEMPDSKDHVYSLLEVLYEPWLSLPYKHFEPKTRNTAQLVLEIATKYEMDPIRQRIIAYIVDYWPCSLAEWDVFEARLKIVEDDERRDDEMDCYAQEPASAIVLARRFEIKSILPAAFYDLARIPSSADWDERQTRAEGATDSVDVDTWNAARGSA
ncbi:hypothetical protein EW145_g3934 [Phellinidium pouzarii]|uniref:MADS-box domain-containing protein n=1 Tax=Phellinidium pouzarii TaxID=167371 RepID=A0A4V3XCP3_9AGAM|nr:hypothetical protein EW145_g3934 [Phellinidium pouzarii]